MQRINHLGQSLFILALVLFIGSCSNFFTNSLAEPFARDKSKLIPVVNAGNVDELIKLSAQDPDLALEVLKDIEAALDTASEADKAKLRAASIDAAANSSGLGSAIFDSAGPIVDLLDKGDLDNPDNKTELIDVVADSIGGLDNLKESADSLSRIIPNPDSDKAGFDAFVENADADQLAMAAIILLSSQATSSAGGSSAYIDGFNADDAGLNPQESLAAKLAESAAKKNEASGGTGPLADMLSALNLYDK